MLYSIGFCNFPQSLQANAAILLQSRPQPLPFTHLPIYYFHIILPIHTCHHILEDLYIWYKGHVTDGSPHSIGNDIRNSWAPLPHINVTCVSSISWFKNVICSCAVWNIPECTSSLEEYSVSIFTVQYVILLLKDLHATTHAVELQFTIPQASHLSDSSDSLQIPKSWGIFVNVLKVAIYMNQSKVKM
jgi:hypothetical protein